MRTWCVIFFKDWLVKEKAIWKIKFGNTLSEPLPPSEIFLPDFSLGSTPRENIFNPHSLARPALAMRFTSFRRTGALLQRSIKNVIASIRLSQSRYTDLIRGKQNQRSVQKGSVAPPENTDNRGKVGNPFARVTLRTKQ